MAKYDIHYTLTVALAHQSYPIYIGENALSDGDHLKKHVASDKLLIVTNKTIAPLYLKSLQTAFTGKQCDVVILPDGEVYKNQHSLALIYDALIECNHHRDTTLIALGGGVIGDITGFAASTYNRGVPFIQIPTTLLAQVDASVGGKTALNHEKGKNLIGTFYQPKAVFIDIPLLKTLPKRELCSGFAEIIKYGLLMGGALLKHIENVLDQDLTQLAPKEWSFLIADCCQVKSQFVREDEREQGSRALLNLGHTFAHALEAYTHYKRWHHGEAVSMGLYCALILSHQLGFIEKKWVDFVKALLIKADLPWQLPSDTDNEALYRLMLTDKKVKHNRICFILLRRLGDAFLTDTVSKEDVLKALCLAKEWEVS